MKTLRVVAVALVYGGAVIVVGHAVQAAVSGWLR